MELFWNDKSFHYCSGLIYQTIIKQYHITTTKNRLTRRRRRSTIPTMTNPEAGKQRFDRFNKKALLFLTTALQAPIMLLMGCGYATDSHGVRRDVRDYGGKLMVRYPLNERRPYVESGHGKITGWLEEGEVVPGFGERPDGKKPIHRHPNVSGAVNIEGTHTFRFE